MPDETTGSPGEGRLRSPGTHPGSPPPQRATATTGGPAPPAPPSYPSYPSAPSGGLPAPAARGATPRLLPVASYGGYPGGGDPRAVPYAGWGTRLGGYLIDAVIFIPVLVVLVRSCSATPTRSRCIS